MSNGDLRTRKIGGVQIDYSTIKPWKSIQEIESYFTTVLGVPPAFSRARDAVKLQVILQHDARWWTLPWREEYSLTSPNVEAIAPAYFRLLHATFSVLQRGRGRQPIGYPVPIPNPEGTAGEAPPIGTNPQLMIGLCDLPVNIAAMILKFLNADFLNPTKQIASDSRRAVRLPAS